MNRRQKLLRSSFAILLAMICLSALRCTPPNSEKVSIRMIGEAYAPLDALAKIKGEFERETGISVEIVQKDHQAVVAELDQELSSRQVTYDMILMPHRLLGKLVEKGHVQPIESFMNDPALHNAEFKPEEQLFSRWWHEISWYGGKAYGYPFTNLTMYVCYRKDMLSDAQEQARFKAKYGRELTPPRTWDEYTQLAEFFNRPGQGYNGTYIQGQQHVALWYEWLNFAYSYNGNILDTQNGWEYGDIVVNSPENVRATEQYIKLLSYSPPEAVNYNWDDALASLQQGRVFMGILWHDQTPLLEDPSASKVAGKMGYALIPSPSGQPVAQLEGWSYLIPTESKHPREAYRFMEWAMRKNVQMEQTLKGGASGLQAIYEDPQVRNIPYVPTFLASIPIGKPKPTIPESAQMTEVMQQKLSEIVTKKRTPQEGLDAAGVEIQRILGDKAKMRFQPKETPK
jgi:multiple sugar transport system substrate-binding protein